MFIYSELLGVRPAKLNRITSGCYFRTAQRSSGWKWLWPFYRKTSGRYIASILPALSQSGGIPTQYGWGGKPIWSRRSGQPKVVEIKSGDTPVGISLQSIAKSMTLLVLLSSTTTGVALTGRHAPVSGASQPSILRDEVETYKRQIAGQMQPKFAV